MSAAPKLRFADEAAAVLAELRRAVERIGDDWDALAVLARTGQAVTAMCERQRYHDEVIAAAITLAGDGERPVPSREQRRHLALVPVTPARSDQPVGCAP